MALAFCRSNMLIFAHSCKDFSHASRLVCIGRVQVNQQYTSATAKPSKMPDRTDPADQECWFMADLPHVGPKLPVAAAHAPVGDEAACICCRSIEVQPVQ